VHLVDAYGRYVGGIHAERINAGVFGAATCNNCHGTHDLKRADDPASKVNKFNIPATCGQCHSEVYQQYERGIHGQALAARVMDAPNCADCHGEHEILAPSGKSSPVNPANLSDYVCAKCHNSPEIMDKYGLKGGRISSYQDSYHGMAVKRGSTKAANCVSCHEAHDILPATNPASSIARGRIVATCQKCHPSASAEFAASYTHEAVIGGPDSIKRIIELIYIPLIIVLIGGMVVHNGIITLHFIRRKRALEKSQVTYERFSRSMVIQHAGLAVSFITLVITGFALRFPDAWWSQPLSSIGLTEQLRGLLHRIAAVVLMVASAYHIVFLIATRRGRTELYHIIPRLSDVRQAWQNIRYHLGWTRIKPDFDRYEYTEKAEYWALVWGTAVMIATGLVLWFPEIFTQHLKGWVVISSETIHYYEAWLATLAIVVWHFYFVIFHPDEFPMSLTWLDGKMTEHTLREKHPAWYRRLAGQGQEPDATASDSRPSDVEPKP
jgi:formate dehydrogenase gamma subunit